MTWQKWDFGARRARDNFSRCVNVDTVGAPLVDTTGLHDVQLDVASIPISLEGMTNYTKICNLMNIQKESHRYRKLYIFLK